MALAFLAGCREREMKRCVDEHNTVVDDSFCENQQGQQQNNNNYYHPIMPGVFRYYYGGWGGYAPGSVVGGGGFAPMAGHSYASPTTRGGFGSSFSGGDGGHGGAGE